MMTSSRCLTFVSLAVLMVSGCNNGGDSSTGILSLQVTDAPFPVTEDCLKEAIIVVDRVEVQGQGGFVEIPLANDDDEDGEVTFDLLDLRAGIARDLSVAELPTGEYHQIRLHIVESFLVFADDTTQSFRVPSGSESGLKINPKPRIQVSEDQTTAFILDFDLSRSFHITATGGEPTCDDLKAGENQVLFNPVIHALNLEENGAISGTVRKDGNPAAGVEVSAFVAGTQVEADTEPVAATFSSPDGLESVSEGQYYLLLEAGYYDIYTRESSSDPFSPGPEDVTVTPVQVTLDLDIVSD